MPDVMTIEEALALVDDLDQRYVQPLADAMRAAALAADELGASQQAYHQALGPAGADIDDDTLAATGDMAIATSAVRDEANDLARAAGDCGALLGAARDSLREHLPLSEQVQAHPGAANMDFYRPS